MLFVHEPRILSPIFQARREKVVMRSQKLNALDGFSTMTSYRLSQFLQTFTLKKYKEIFKEIEIHRWKENSNLYWTSFFISTLRSSRKNADQLYNKSGGSGIEACYLFMSSNRFRILTRCLIFDYVRNIDERKSTYNLAPIRQLF